MAFKIPRFARNDKYVLFYYYDIVWKRGLFLLRSGLGTESSIGLETTLNIRLSKNDRFCHFD